MKNTKTKAHMSFEATMTVAGYPVDMFVGFDADGEWAYHDKSANIAFDAWQFGISTHAARPVADAGEAALYVRQCDIDGSMPHSGGKVIAYDAPGAEWTVPLYRAAPAARTLSEQIAELRAAIEAESSMQVKVALLDELGDVHALLVAPSKPAEAPSVRDPRLQYWLDGTRLIEACLAKAEKAEFEDAPFPLDPEQAALWHRAQLEAYRHALEMMGVPEDEPLRALQGKPEAPKGGSHG